jgi:hypothetical protein
VLRIHAVLEMIVHAIHGLLRKRSTPLPDPLPPWGRGS